MNLNRQPNPPARALFRAFKIILDRVFRVLGVRTSALCRQSPFVTLVTCVTHSGPRARDATPSNRNFRRSVLSALFGKSIGVTMFIRMVNAARRRAFQAILKGPSCKTPGKRAFWSNTVFGNRGGSS